MGKSQPIPGSQLQSLLQLQAGHLLEADPRRSNAKWYGDTVGVFLKDGFQGGRVVFRWVETTCVFLQM